MQKVPHGHIYVNSISSYLQKSLLNIGIESPILYYIRDPGILNITYEGPRGPHIYKKVPIYMGMGPRMGSPILYCIRDPGSLKMGDPNFI